MEQLFSLNFDMCLFVYICWRQNRWDAWRNAAAARSDGYFSINFFLTEKLVDFMVSRYLNDIARLCIPRGDTPQFL